MNKRLYRIDVRIYGTLYIKATSAKQAKEIAKKTKDSSLSLQNGPAGDLDINSSSLDVANQDLPDISLSPAMTVVGPDDDSNPEVV